MPTSTPSPRDATLSIAIFLFDDVEVLDFAGPYEVFTTASRVQCRRVPEGPPPFRVFTVGRSSAAIVARAGLILHPDHAIGSHPAIDVLLIPGGDVSRQLDQPDVIDWIARTSASIDLCASICTGAFLLAKAGLLNDRSATTHWEDIEDLRRAFPRVDVRSNQRWVDAGAVVTSGGISAGIDMSLHLVERLAGRDLALLTARQMEFDWQQNPA